MGIFSKLFGGGTPEEKAAKAEARAEREAQEQAEADARAREVLARALGQDPKFNDLKARRNAAIKLVLINQPVMGREAWMSIGRDYPSELADALEQVGVCFQLEKNYREAVNNYEAALRMGADRDRLADNLAEARKGLAGLR
jgi:tetratricopeptide (TPR) repeat protein